MSDLPQRTNTYTAAPISDRYRECLFDWLAAHAPFWNQVTYRRRQQYFAEDGDVWAADYTDLYDDYAPVLGKATCQQVARKNSEAWRSHFRLLEMYHDDSEATVTEKPSPPGYWGTREKGYELHGRPTASRPESRHGHSFRLGTTDEAFESNFGADDFDCWVETDDLACLEDCLLKLLVGPVRFERDAIDVQVLVLPFPIDLRVFNRRWVL